VTIVFDDGQRFEVSGTVLVGRNPVPGPDERVDTLIPLNDLSRSISKTHASLRWDGRVLWVGDRGSTNGTVLGEATGARRIGPQTEDAAVPGSRVNLGDRFFTIEPLGTTTPGGQR
jgi:pSer/pThr/pTyr-binding forkhead associated (FHA) protein